MTYDHASYGKYDDEVDFAALAMADDEFARVCRNGKIDLHDADSVQQLTKSLLKRDFGLSLILPGDRLCPPVPIRYAYITFLHSLLSTTTPSYSLLSPSTPITGLDIGTGASCIYPLLGTALYPSWTFHATDIDPHSLSYAEQNVTLNALRHRIKPALSTLDTPLLPLDQLRVARLDFAMCNPPFYGSAADKAASEAAKSGPAAAVCTGSAGEMVVEGGDAGFVGRMVDESVALRERVGWYSSMLGKLGSVHVVVARLKEVGCRNWAVTVLKGGRKTRRWVVAWSWGDLRPRNDVCRGEGVAVGLLPQPTAQTVRLYHVNQARERLEKILGELDLRWKWRDDEGHGIMEADDNVWSRSARRRKARDEDTAMDDGTTTGQTKLAVAIGITSQGLDVRWLRGQDFVLFESFCTMLKRRMDQT